MTQSYNLSQLANNLNSSGQLLLASGISGSTPIANGGTNATTAAGARTNLDVAQAVFAVPSGGIIMWSGSIATIPTGWFLCNGANSTPDLRNRFIIGANVDNGGVANTSITGSNTQSGGSKDAIVPFHGHTFTGSALATHSHYVGSNDSTANDGGNPLQEFVRDYNAGNGPATYTNPVSAGTPSGSISDAGSSGNATNANLVPYYALAFIMKS
jgi:microcystin-dependent protein